MLIDSDVLIWVLRGNKRAAKLIDSVSDRFISIVTHMELMQGARDRKELKAIKAFLTDNGFVIIPLSENIGHRASIYIEEYGLKVRMCVADALIAATAVESNEALCTGHRQHYGPIGELEMKVFRP